MTTAPELVLGFDDDANRVALVERSSTPGDGRWISVDQQTAIDFDAQMGAIQ